MSSLDRAIEACGAARQYAALYASLEQSPELSVDLHARDLSHALFYQLCNIKYAAWRYRVNFRRARRHSIADIFQDLVAFYLRAALPRNYEISVEEAKTTIANATGKLVTVQPDICIRFNGKVHFVIEAKTTIGWARPDFSQAEDMRYSEMRERIDNITAAFGVPDDRVIFVFEEPSNVSSKHFLPNFWDKKRNLPVTRPTTGVPAHIYPLFNETDPSRWTWKKDMPPGRSRQDWYPSTLSDERILAHASHSVVTPFEDLLALIRYAPALSE